MRIHNLAVVMVLSGFAVGQSIAKQTEQREQCIQSLSGYESTSKAEPAIPTNFSGIKITYSESGCFGSCPSYSLELQENEIRFNGKGYTRAKGKKRAKLKPGEFAAVVKAWFDGRFYLMRPDYCQPKCPDGTILLITDVPEYSVDYSSPELTHGVSRCSAFINGKSETPVPPEAFFTFQKIMRTLAKSHNWL